MIFNINSIKAGAPTRGTVKLDDDTLKKYIDFYASRLAAYGYDDKSGNRAMLARFCAKYFANATPKGLALVGDTGRGKTLFFKIFSKLFGLRMYTAPELVERWQRLGIDGREDLFTELRGNAAPYAYPEGYENCWKDIVIDDVGTEPTLNDFGTKLEVIDAIITRRVLEFESTQAMTFITCNLKLEGAGADSIAGRYGARLESRLHQICHVVALKGNDRRKSKGD